MSSIRIVVIGKNESNTLQRVFNSVLIAGKNYQLEFNQVPEIIYVDSNSTDSSVQIAKDNNIPTIVINENPNPAKARNAGLKNCNTDYIFFLDGDTEVDASWLIEGVKFLEQNKETAGVGGMLKNVFYSDNDEPKFVIENYRNVIEEVEEINDSVGGTFLFRTQPLKNVNGFNELLRVSEEFELMLRLLYCNQRIVRIKKPMATHHDYKTKATLISYLKRNIFTSDIFTPGYVIVSVPKNKIVMKTILHRYSYHLIYVPLFLIGTVMLCLSYYFWSILIFFLLVLSAFLYRNFNFMRAIVALLSTMVFSFGLYAGIIFYFCKIKIKPNFTKKLTTQEYND